MNFEKKLAVFNSHKGLKARKISYDRINYDYPESQQRGGIIATQLHPNGNGYVLGKYMNADLIKKRGYKLDSRGWIKIKDFTKSQLEQVIQDAMFSMSGKKI